MNVLLKVVIACFLLLCANLQVEAMFSFGRKKNAKTIGAPSPKLLDPEYLKWKADLLTILQKYSATQHNDKKSFLFDEKDFESFRTGLEKVTEITHLNELHKTSRLFKFVCLDHHKKFDKKSENPEHHYELKDSLDAAVDITHDLFLAKKPELKIDIDNIYKDDWLGFLLYFDYLAEGHMKRYIGNIDEKLKKKVDQLFYDLLFV